MLVDGGCSGLLNGSSRTSVSFVGNQTGHRTTENGRSETYGRKARARDFAHRCIPTQPYVAPHTAKIHTLITLGISIRTKPLVLKARERLPCGFDSHRPLHSQATPGHAGPQDWGQDIDPMGKSWESTLRRRRSHGLTYHPLCPEIHTYSHTQQFAKIFCGIPALPS